MVTLSGADIVGLDIGVSSIKAVRLRQTMGGRKSITYFRRVVPVEFPWTDIDQRTRFVKEFMHANRLVGLPLVTAVTCGEISLRTIGVPFHDIRKVGQLVPNEVESMIPLPLDEAAVGYQVLPSSRSATVSRQGALCHAVVAIASVEMLTAHIQRMREAGFEPTAVQPDALALFSISRFLRERRQGFPPNLVIIDIGASKTTICVTLKGNPWLLRTIGHGLNHLTRSTAGPVSAPDVHDDHDLIGSAGGMIEPGFSTLLRELRLTLHTYQSTAETPVRQVLFCGGGAGIPALTRELSQRLKLEPLHVSFLHQVRWRSAYSIALGLALLGRPMKTPILFVRPQSGSGIDLKNALSNASPKGQNPLGSFRRLGFGVVLIALLGFADLATNVVLKEQRLRTLSEASRTMFQKHFPDIAPITDELDQAKTALSAAQKAKELMGGDHVPVLPRLTALVTQFPQGTKLNLIGLTIEPNAVQIEGMTDSFDSVELIKRKLQAIPEVQEITIRDVSVGSLPGQVMFRLTIAMP